MGVGLDRRVVGMSIVTAGSSVLTRSVTSTAECAVSSSPRATSGASSGATRRLSAAAGVEPASQAPCPRTAMVGRGGATLRAPSSRPTWRGTAGVTSRWIWTPGSLITLTILRLKTCECWKKISTECEPGSTSSKCPGGKCWPPATAPTPPPTWYRDGWCR